MAGTLAMSVAVREFGMIAVCQVPRRAALYSDDVRCATRGQAECQASAGEFSYRSPPASLPCAPSVRIRRRVHLCGYAGVDNLVEEWNLGYTTKSTYRPTVKQRITASLWIPRLVVPTLALMLPPRSQCTREC